MAQEWKDHVGHWLEHVRALAEEIGPRGSTTPEERRASEYCRRVMDQAGLQARIEPFTSARSIYHPHLLASIIMLAAFAIYPLAGRSSAVIAALLSLIALISDLMELSFRDNLLRRLVPKGPSQNVVAQVSPAGEHRRDLVLIGHVDSHRTPIIFRSPRWVAVYQAFTTIAFVFFLIQVVLFTLGAFMQWSWIWFASIPSAVCGVLLAAMCIQADLTPFSAGANDNASSAGLVLELAESLHSEPLEHTRLWLVCTGCEEVQHYGAIDFFRQHRSDLQNPIAIAFEMLGCAGPAWLTQEGIVIPFHSDARLVSLAERLAAEHPEWKAHASQINGGNTEMADALRVGIPAITIIGMGANGEMPYWHQVEDTFDKMDPEVMGRAYAFIRDFIRSLDEGGIA
ncbi:MAG TPA: Zn-dependent exopeptidase M28 [Anaerolineae bacterium]|nr:Zn-dependent exopeptidase M28 [Anaerolineae bacterium]